MQPPGLGAIAQTPKILLAVNPVYAWEFFAANHLHGVVVLGSVVLCITGGEALYADLGHFGRRAIRLSWLGLAFPALLLNYFGQGALLIDHPELNFHPFYGLVPSGLLYPMVALSTIATVIASQALISGVFSLTQQAIQLGLCPRVHIVHTSADVRGQIFIPGVNFALMLACIGLVSVFQRVQRAGRRLRDRRDGHHEPHLGLCTWWPRSRSGAGRCGRPCPWWSFFCCSICAYFGANLLKIFDGGWITLAVAFAIMTTMTTWRKGREELKRKLFANRVPLDVFLADLERQALARVRGTAVFMTLSLEGAPPTLLHHVKHNHMLHEHVVLLTLQSADVPVGGERGPPAHRTPSAGVLSTDGMVWLHGNPECTEGS